MAQSLLLAIAPRALAAVCEPPYDYEDPSGTTGGLAEVSSLDPDDVEGYLEMISPLGAELILDIGRYDGSHSNAIEQLRSASSIHCQLIDLTDSTFQEAATIVSSLFGVELEDDVCEMVEQISSWAQPDEAYSSEIGFTVCACAGDDGMTACGSSSELGSFLMGGAGRSIDISGSASYSADEDSAVLDSNDFLDGDVVSPDIVILMERQAGIDYVNGCDVGLWRVLDPGRLGYVFPGLVGGRVWLADMSPLARATLGTTWSTRLLRGCSAEGYDFNDELCEDYYRLLYGACPDRDEEADACSSFVKQKLPLDKTAYLQEKESFQREQGEQGQAISDALDAEAERTYSVDELRDYYVSLCSGWGRDATDEGFEEFLETCRAEGIVKE